MTVENLIEILQGQVKVMPRKKHDTVKVKIDERWVGPSATVDIKSVGFGFDWDDGTFIIYPEVPLIKKKKSK